MEIQTKKSVCINKPEYLLVVKAIYDIEVLLGVFAEGEEIPENCKVMVEVENFAYTTEDIFSTLMIVRVVAPEKGSFAARIDLFQKSPFSCKIELCITR